MSSEKPESIIEILAIGREILDGRVVDTNSVYLAQKLKELGLTPRFAQKVDDVPERMMESFEIAQNRADIVLVTGGLGPTSDDLTAEIFARFAKVNIETNAIALKQVQDTFKRINRPMLEIQKKQAQLPQGCEVLQNTTGTAPAFSFTHKNKKWFFMPGVPKEMKTIFEEHILKKLPQNLDFQNYTWVTHFTSEGELQERLSHIIKKIPSDFEFAFRTRMPENHLSLHGSTSDAPKKKLFKSLCEEISNLLGDDVFAKDKIAELEEVVVELLKKKKVFIATVESCTGGLIAHRLTNVSGASDVFYESHVCYDNGAKINLGVDAKTIEKNGAVSEETAKALAQAGLKSLIKLLPPKSAALCVATTGIAGPSGGTADKPVGLCFIGLACTWNETQTTRFQTRTGLSRQENKNFFAQKALDLVRRNFLI